MEQLEALKAELARVVGEIQAEGVRLRGVSEQTKSELVKLLADAQALHTRGQDTAPVRGGIFKPEDVEQWIGKRKPSAGTVQVRAVSVADVGDIEAPTIRPQVVEYALRPVALVDLVPVVQSGRTYQFNWETELSALGAIRTKLDGATVANELTCTLASVAGLVDESLLRLYPSGGGFVERKIKSWDEETKIVTVDAAWGAIYADECDVAILVAGAVAESATKGESGAHFEQTELTLKTLPLLFPMTEQALLSYTSLEAWAATRLRRHIRRSIEWGLLYGDGTTTIHGLAGAAGALTYSWSDGTVGDNMADCLLRAAALIPAPAQKYAIISHEDWLDILLAKNAEDDYVHTPGRALVVQGTDGRWRIGDLIVATSAACVQGDFFIWCEGASERPAIDQGRFALGYVNDQFARNEITARYEEDTEHAILSLQLFVVGEFDEAPAAPEA